MLSNCKIVPAKVTDTEEILSLYRTHLFGPADWDETYPSKDTIAFDLSRNALFVMKNSDGEIIATASIDSDEEVEKLDCWDKNLQPSGEVSRICVRDDMKNNGIAKKMMQFVFDKLKNEGCKSVHILVKTGHIVAMKSYAHLNFKSVGECNLFNKDFICMERTL